MKWHENPGCSINMAGHHTMFRLYLCVDAKKSSYYYIKEIVILSTFLGGPVCGIQQTFKKIFFFFHVSQHARQNCLEKWFSPNRLQVLGGYTNGHVSKVRVVDEKKCAKTEALTSSKMFVCLSWGGWLPCCKNMLAVGASSYRSSPSVYAVLRNGT